MKAEIINARVDQDVEAIITGPQGAAVGVSGRLTKTDEDGVWEICVPHAMEKTPIGQGPDGRLIMKVEVSRARNYAFSEDMIVVLATVTESLEDAELALGVKNGARLLEDATDSQIAKPSGLIQ